MITMFALSTTMYASGVFDPVIGGLLWPRATRAGALAAIIARSAGGLAGVFGLVDYGGVPEVVVGGLASLVAFIVVSLLTKPDQTQVHDTVRQEPATES